MEKSNPRPLVVLLICLIVGFLFVIVNMFNKAEPKMNSVIASSEIDEPDLNSVQINAGVLQSNSTEMEGRINELEQQLATERIEANAKLEALAREKKALEIRGSDLLAQLDRSQKQLQTTTSQTTPAYEPEQKASVNPINNTRYRVTRLANGDTLNLRAIMPS
jgi:seryl-tRNA synthetase